MQTIVRHRWIHIIMLCLLSAGVYAHALHAPFYLDDRHVITENRAILSVPDLLRGLVTDSRETAPAKVVKTRVLGIVTFAINYALHGLDPAGFRLVNIAIHCANTLLVYWLVLFIFRAPAADGRGPDRSHVCAFFCAAIFAVHPVQTQAVTYLSQRFASLAFFFCLASLLFYTRARMSSQKYGQFALLFCATLCSAAAMFTKEIAFVMPLIIALYEFLFFREKTRRRLLLLSPLLLTMLIIPFTMLAASAGDLDITAIGNAAHAATASGFSRAEYGLTQARVVVTYLRLFFLPINQTLDYDYPLLHSPADPQVMLPLLLLAGLLCAAVLLFARAEKAKAADRFFFRLILFGTLWFFLALSVESSFIPIDDLIFEHRMYLPMPGLILAAGGCFLLLRPAPGEKKHFAVALALVLLLGTATVARNALWTDPVRFSQDMVMKGPNKARPHINLGYAYEGAGFLEEAARAYEESLRLKPNDALARFNLGNVYFKNAWYEKAGREYQTVIALDPDFSEAHNNLGNTYLQLGRVEDAAREFRAALVFDPGFTRARFNLDRAERLLEDSRADAHGR